MAKKSGKKAPAAKKKATTAAKKAAKKTTKAGKKKVTKTAPKSKPATKKSPKKKPSRRKKKATKRAAAKKKVILCSGKEVDETPCKKELPEAGYCNDHDWQNPEHIDPENPERMPSESSSDDASETSGPAEEKPVGNWLLGDPETPAEDQRPTPAPVQPAPVVTYPPTRKRSWSAGLVSLCCIISFLAILVVIVLYERASIAEGKIAKVSEAAEQGKKDLASARGRILYLEQELASAEPSAAGAKVKEYEAKFRELQETVRAAKKTLEVFKTTTNAQLEQAEDENERLKEQLAAARSSSGSSVDFSAVTRWLDDFEGAVSDLRKEVDSLSMAEAASLDDITRRMERLLRKTARQRP